MASPIVRPSRRRQPQVVDADDRKERIDWIEKQGLDSITARFATADLIAKEAQTTLTVLLAGIGATAAYAAKLLEPGPPEPLTVAAAAVCGYLAALSAILVFACMMLRGYPAQFQEPKNLLLNNPLLDIRESELHNLDKRIKAATALNNGRARRLNQIRLLAVFSIVIFVAVAAVAPRRAPSSPASIAVECSPARGASAPALSCRLGG